MKVISPTISLGSISWLFWMLLQINIFTYAEAQQDNLFERGGWVWYFAWIDYWYWGGWLTSDNNTSHGFLIEESGLQAFFATSETDRTQTISIVLLKATMFGLSLLTMMVWYPL